MSVQPTLRLVMTLLGAGFLLANGRVFLHYLRFVRMRRGALLTWTAGRPPQYALQLGIGVVLGLLVFYKLVIQQVPPGQAFGELMMFLYYAYARRLERRIRRGFYHDGIWTDAGFIPYGRIGGISWREGEHEIGLVVIERQRNLARRLAVPGASYAAARRLLRDRIAAHDITFDGTGLHLGGHDVREDV